MDEFGSTPSAVVESTGDPLSPDDVFGVLAARQRRRLLVALHRAETPERLSALARSLAAETDGSADGEAVDRLRTVLYHWHVPTLVELGLVVYDPEPDAVDLTEEGRSLVAVLDR